MPHVWLTTVDGNLLRADQIRQINAVEGLRAVLIGGDQFLIADIDGLEACTALARELAAAIAESDTWTHAAEIAVVDGPDGWTLKLQSIRGDSKSPVDSE